MINRSYLLTAALILTLFMKASSAQYRQNTVHNFADTLRPASLHHSYLRAPSLILPASLLLYGSLKPVVNAIPELDNNIFNNIEQNHSGFQTNAVDYLMWTPSASLYVMDAFKVKTKHSFKEHLIIDAGSVLITGGIGYGMRILSKNIKVYNTKGTKFPSGHTANAFRGAEIVHQELKDHNPVLSYSGYLVAAGVGMMRIYGREHLLSEVLTGAGLGILSAKLTYWVFQKVK